MASHIWERDDRHRRFEEEEYNKQLFFVIHPVDIQFRGAGVGVNG